MFSYRIFRRHESRDIAARAFFFKEIESASIWSVTIMQKLFETFQCLFLKNVLTALTLRKKKKKKKCFEIYNYCT